MNHDLHIFKKLADSLRGLFHDALTKLDTLSVVNVLLMFALVLVVVTDSLGNSVLGIIYILLDWVGQVLLKKQPLQPSIDLTPFWIYALFLIGGIFLCLIIVKKHLSGKLW